MGKFLHFTLYALLLLSVVALVQPAYAQSGDNTVTDDDVNEVAKDLYCPVCENTPLDVCATQACADWRELIRTKLDEGQSPQQIFDYFARQYGDGVLANPPRRGISLVILWVLPVVLVLVGVLFFGRYVTSLRSQNEPTPATAGGNLDAADVSAQPAPDKDDYTARVEQELRRGA